MLHFKGTHTCLIKHDYRITTDHSGAFFHKRASLIRKIERLHPPVTMYSRCNPQIREYVILFSFTSPVIIIYYLAGELSSGAVVGIP